MSTKVRKNKSKFVYDPNKSVREMAKECGLTESTVKTYIKEQKITHQVNRVKKTMRIMENCILSHPGSTLNELSKLTNYSIKTVHEYKEKILRNNEKNYSDFLSKWIKERHEGRPCLKKEGEQRAYSQRFSELALIASLDRISADNKLSLKTRNVLKESDYLSLTIEHNGNKITDNKIGVDYNTYSKGKLLFVFEVKSNLDKDYLKRAAYDFVQVARAIKQNGGDPSKTKYVIFALQPSIADDSLQFAQAYFEDETNKLFDITLHFDVFFLTSEKRNNLSFIDSEHTINKEEAIRFENFIVNTVSGVKGLEDTNVA